MKDIKTYINENIDGLYALLERLCAIPAPSNHEEKRAGFCEKWLKDVGCEGVYTDPALNVIAPFNCENSREMTVFAAHTDTVFPDLEPMPYSDDGKFLRSPGVGDDTASLAILMYCAKYLAENGVKPEKGVMLVCNSGEEGLGNLKGVKRLFADFPGRISRFISFDSSLDVIFDRCVGSHRYEVTVTAEGGHSFSKFGNTSAVAELAKLINAIYSIKVPQREGVRTTYNVGVISGGTSVNTIAQNASMLCEYRSDSAECLDMMKREFFAIFDGARRAGVGVDVKLAGERPCAENVDPAALAALRDKLAAVMEDVIGSKVSFRSASTDCNIPLSLGVPAVCIGVWRGGGAHTREEWIEKASLPVGLEAALRSVAALSD